MPRRGMSRFTWAMVARKMARESLARLRSAWKSPLEASMSRIAT